MLGLFYGTYPIYSGRMRMRRIFAFLPPHKDDGYPAKGFEKLQKQGKALPPDTEHGSSLGQSSLSNIPGEDKTELSRLRPMLLFVVNVDWFFLSHRLPIALAARDAGIKVLVAAADTGRGAVIRQHGLVFLPMPMSRKLSGLVPEIRALMFLVRLYHKFKPDLVHHVTMKPILYGSFAAWLTRRRAVVNAISGLGYAFSSHGHAEIRHWIAKNLYRMTLHLSQSRTIFQNCDDLEEFCSSGLLPREQAVLIRGSGVDCSRFRPTTQPEGNLIVMLPSRMLWNKGVGEFVDAAKSIRDDQPDVRFVLVGSPDKGNRLTVPLAKLNDWAQAGIVEWWDQKEDMVLTLSGASIVVLPTYREGLPKILLEAAASARPIVATDVPGCREIVRHGVNGLLVPPRNSVALAKAIQTLLRSPELREQFGKAGREIAVAEFSKDIVVAQTLSLYREILGNRWPCDTVGKLLS